MINQLANGTEEIAMTTKSNTFQPDLKNFLPKAKIFIIISIMKIAINRRSRINSPPSKKRFIASDVISPRMTASIQISDIIRKSKFLPSTSFFTLRLSVSTAFFFMVNILKKLTGFSF